MCPCVLLREAKKLTKNFSTILKFIFIVIIVVPVFNSSGLYICLVTESKTLVCMLSLQSCPTLCNPMDCILPGSSVHGILQARILEWVVMPSSRGSSQPRDGTRVSYVSCIGRQLLYH